MISVYLCYPCLFVWVIARDVTYFTINPPLTKITLQYIRQFQPHMVCIRKTESIQGTDVIFFTSISTQYSYSRNRLKSGNDSSVKSLSYKIDEAMKDGDKR